MGKLLKVFRNAVFLGSLCMVLLSTTIAVGLFSLQLTAQVASMSATAAATALAHRKQLTKAVAKTKAKGRLRRVIAAVPIAGVAAIVYFEEQDYREWKSENPEGTRRQYAAEVGCLSAEVIDEVLQELPEMVRPRRQMILDRLPECPSQEEVVELKVAPASMEESTRMP